MPGFTVSLTPGRNGAGIGQSVERAQDLYPCKCELVHKLSLRSLLALLREMNLKFAKPISS